MRPCPNCGQEVAADKAFCPHCGADVSANWPPPRTDAKPDDTPPPRDELQVVNGGATGCILTSIAYIFLGATAVAYRVEPERQPNLFFRHGTWTISLVPLAIVGGLYFLIRPRFPAFARGLGYSLLVVLVLLLFGLVACRN